MQFKASFSHYSLVTLLTFELLLVMSFSIVDVQLYLGNSCKGTVITEQCLSSRAVLTVLLVIAVLFPHMSVE